MTCVEIYKTAYKLNGRQVMQLFSQYEIPEYIVSCYGALHTTGLEYIIEDIAGLIADRRQKENRHDGTNTEYFQNPAVDN